MQGVYFWDSRLEQTLKDVVGGQQVLVGKCKQKVSKAICSLFALQHKVCIGKDGLNIGPHIKQIQAWENIIDYHR